MLEHNLEIKAWLTFGIALGWILRSLPSMIATWYNYDREA